MYIKEDVRKLQPCTWKFSYRLCEKFICMLNIKPRKAQILEHDTILQAERLAAISNSQHQTLLKKN